MAAQPAPILDDISCIIIPLARDQLLLPNVCVAEILPWRRMKPLDGSPGWCLGILGWRGQSVVVIDFEALLYPSDNARGSRRSLVVMNRSGTTKGPAFYALSASGLPRMIQVGESELGATEKPKAAGSKAVAMVATVGTETAMIPDLKQLETLIGSVSR